MAVNHYQNLVDNINYEDINEWQIPDIYHFSDKKVLFPYQVEALKNTAKLLKTFYSSPNGKKELYEFCISNGMESNFCVQKYIKPIDERKGIANPRFELLSEYYNINDDYKTIDGAHFFNRCAYWMATASGKTIVLIKVIEYISYLKEKGLIPNYDIMLLLPKENLLEQFKELVIEYNNSRNPNSRIEIVNLKDYDSDKANPSIIKSIKIYYYRSDLIRDEKKENILDFKDYDNAGKWYIFLDEAHRGETGSSTIQDYITILCRNGFLFNFSATFTDEIDYATTVYNFNLEKFINGGYGKNIYLCKSSFEFDSALDEFSVRTKQLQVLKSMLVYTLIKKQRTPNLYHSPLMVTLVNTVNTEDSDLLMFFKIMESIAGGDYDADLLEQAKESLLADFNFKNYVYGDEKLTFDKSLLINLTIKDILYFLFNSKTHGKIELLEGEENKEIVLKLQTSSKAFALIKIGNADSFQSNLLGPGYLRSMSYYNINYFQSLNSNDDINILLGSRSFYEGWDSNRPNVINFINIGGADAQKYVLQSLGRGVRIEPISGYRKRLPLADTRKSCLMETLFVFATDRNGVESILKTIEHEKSENGKEIELIKNATGFDLLIPKYKQSESRNDFNYFYVSRKTKESFEAYFKSMPANLAILKYGIIPEQYFIIKDKIEKDEFFAIKEDRVYYDMDFLFELVAKHVSLKNYVVSDIHPINDEIVHFKHIRAINLSDTELIELSKKIKNISNYSGETTTQLAKMLANGEITEDEFNQRNAATKKEDTFKDVVIAHIAKHYYLPVIYSLDEKVSYLKNIITHESETMFVKSLVNGMSSIPGDVDWMFSKLQENTDSIYIPYYCYKDNSYHKFYPDFIFWIKKGNKYKIVFVDPKGTQNTDYLNKVDEYERIFTDNGKPKNYKYADYEIIFDLKLVGEDRNKVPAKYRSYWLTQGDFNFINI